MKKIVIELSDETYNDVIEEHYLNVSNTNIYNAIRNGTPLQEKYGEIKAEINSLMTVNICGIPHKVIYCKDSFDIDTHLGMICYKENEIRINEDMSENQKKETLCHEMVHGMLIHLGFNDLSDNEQFVQALGNAIYQGFEVKENKEWKEKKQ